MTAETAEVKSIRERLIREKKQRAKAALFRTLVWIALPTCVAAVYYGLLASPRYASNTVLNVVSTLDLSAEEGSGTSVQGAYFVRDIVLSQDMLVHLESTRKYSDHFSSDAIDMVARLPKNAGTERRFEHYTEHVHVDVDERSANLKMVVEAFDADEAVALSEAIVEELRRELKRLDDAAYEVYLAGIQEQTAAAVALRNRAPGTGDGFGAEVAEEQYRLAVESLARARSQKRTHQRQVELIDGPSQPDQASGPARVRGVITVGSFAVCFFVIGSLLLASIRDHARM